VAEITRQHYYTKTIDCPLPSKILLPQTSKPFSGIPIAVILVRSIDVFNSMNRLLPFVVGKSTDLPTKNCEQKGISDAVLSCCDELQRNGGQTV